MEFENNQYEKLNFAILLFFLQISGPTNTSSDNGVIPIWERHFNRQYLWCICLLHLLELILRELVTIFDGCPNGPGTYFKKLTFICSKNRYTCVVTNAA